jgi:hypothetical protein
MIAPVLQIVWSYRRLLVLVTCLTFVALAIVIFALPTRETVRSAIEIGSAVVSEKPEPFELPEQVARRITSVYGPAALLAMAQKGISPAILNALQNPNVESIGRSVVISSTVGPGVENEAKRFQETIADQIIKDLEPRARAWREDIANQMSIATRASDRLEQSIKADEDEIKRTSALYDDLRGQLENQRTNLAKLYQRAGTPLQPGETTVVESQIRELNEQIAGQTNLLGGLALERSDVTRDLARAHRLFETQGRATADAKFDQNSFSETHVSLPPSLIPVQTTPRRLSLLLVAFTISVLAGFGTVVLLHNFVVKKI